MTAQLSVRDRLALLLDDDSFVADGAAADGVITGRGTVDGRPAIVVAGDPTQDARTVEQAVRATEVALRDLLPVFWLLDPAEAPVPAPAGTFAGRRGTGRLFHQQVALSGTVPQICCLFGPAAGDGACLPGLADALIMVDGRASLCLGGPHTAEPVSGEQATLEERGGARMHCTVSGVGDLLADDDTDAIELARLFFSYLPSARREQPPSYLGEEPATALGEATVPETGSRPFDIHDVIDGLVDDDSFFELGPLFAPELVVGYGRMDGRTVGIVANNSAANGGLLCADSADKAARFLRMCDAYSIPLVHLVDVPGFASDAAAERGGMIRYAATMVSAVARATVPQLCVVVRKAYGAGLHAMCGPGLGPDATIALPTARIAPLPPDDTVQAAYAGQIAAIEDDTERAEFVQARRARHLEDVAPERLASDLVVDAVVPAAGLRGELLRRLAYAARRDRDSERRRRAIPPA